MVNYANFVVSVFQGGGNTVLLRFHLCFKGIEFLWFELQFFEKNGTTNANLVVVDFHWVVCAIEMEKNSHS